jgi:hypothetical protein
LVRLREIDLNRRLIKDKLSWHFSPVKSPNESWLDDVRRDFYGPRQNLCPAGRRSRG